MLGRNLEPETFAFLPDLDDFPGDGVVRRNDIEGLRKIVTLLIETDARTPGRNIQNHARDRNVVGTEDNLCFPERALARITPALPQRR